MAKKQDTITVTAKTTLFEDAVLYQPGETLEVTPDRAAALGDAVTLPA